MESSNRKITFKVIFGYIALGILAAISGWLVFSELRNFTNTQSDDLQERNKIIKVSNLVADIYENESLGRAALQLNSEEKFSTSISQNDSLLAKIDSLRLLVNTNDEKELLDSIKVVLNKKQLDLNELRRIKANNNSEESIENTIKKLNSIDPILGKITLDEYVENPLTTDPKIKEVLEGFINYSNEVNAKATVSKVDQRKIDSIVTASKIMLKKIQKQAAAQKQTLMLKERELVENDLKTSRQMRNLLQTLEKEMVNYAEHIGQQRQQTLDRSIEIISLAAIVSFILVIIFSVVILNDFWKSQKYRDQLEKSNTYTNDLLKSREQLINMVSHDLRSPLSTISGYSELLQKTAQNSKEENYLDHIKNASNYMSQLVDDLLEFSKLEDGHITMEMVPFNLNNIVDETSENIKAIYDDKPIELILKKDSALDVSLASDPFRIRQILYNLIGNAYKFTEKGTIIVTTKLLAKNENYSVVVTVSDTGIGISKAKQNDIFNAFTQVNQNSDSKQGGFGLGLAITKKIVSLLKGNLTLHSIPGKGSSFEITFPVKLSKTKAESPVIPSETTHLKLKAVIVDDDVSLRQLLTDVLEQHQITTYTFEDAKAALDALEHLKFDVIITDIQLPKMNGFHFMETVKKLPFYKGQPIIAMTGRSDIKTEDYLESGFSKVVLKPFKSYVWYEILSGLFPDRIIQPETNKNKKTSYSCDYFDTSSIAGFLNYEEDSLKSLLTTFLNDTEKHINELETAMAEEDLKTVNDLSHRMLTMFKQIKATTIVPYLEKLEHTKEIDRKLFEDLKFHMVAFNIAMNTYLNQDYTP